MTMSFLTLTRYFSPFWCLCYHEQWYFDRAPPEELMANDTGKGCINKGRSKHA